MSIEPPEPSELARIADGFGFALTEDQLTEYAALIDSGLAAYRRLDELPTPATPVKYPRRDPGYRPPAEENTHGGWVWRCSIRGAAEGPLAGKRVAVKDNVCVAGIPMRNGSPIMTGYLPREDATVVTRLLDAGAEIVGKTAVPGFCADGGGLTGFPEPQPVNPYHPDHLPGASSSGCAVVIVTGQADLALGGDQGGSIRLPAAWSGCCGLKPSYGLVPCTGAFGLERTLDHVGPMAATVAGCALMLDAIAGPDGLDPRQAGVPVGAYLPALDRGLDRVRVGVLREAFAIPGLSEPAVDAAVRAAADTLARGGATVEEVSVPLHRDGHAIWSAVIFQGAADLVLRGDGTGTNCGGHFPVDLTDFYHRARLDRASEFPPTVVFTTLLGNYVTARAGHHYYAKAHGLARELRRQYADALRRFDVLALPTTAMRPFRKSTDGSITRTIALALGNMQNTAPFNVTGNPALSLPCGVSDGLPVGLMLVGRHHDDETVLRVGHAYEQLRGPLPEHRKTAVDPAV